MMTAIKITNKIKHQSLDAEYEHVPLWLDICKRMMFKAIAFLCISSDSFTAPRVRNKNRISLVSILSNNSCYIVFRDLLTSNRNLPNCALIKEFKPEKLRRSDLLIHLASFSRP